MGRKYAYLSGIGLYTIGALAASMSNCTRQLAGFRVIQGMGGAGMLTMSSIIIVDILPLRKRAAYSAIATASGALGSICGPLFAAVLFEKFTWVSTSPPSVMLDLSICDNNADGLLA